MSNDADPAYALDRELYQALFEQRTLVMDEALEQRDSNRLFQGLLLAAEDPHEDIRLRRAAAARRPSRRRGTG